MSRVSMFDFLMRQMQLTRSFSTVADIDLIGQAMYSPRLTGARGLSHGHIFTRDGWLATWRHEIRHRPVLKGEASPV